AAQRCMAHRSRRQPRWRRQRTRRGKREIDLGETQGPPLAQAGAAAPAQAPRPRRSQSRRAPTARRVRMPSAAEDAHPIPKKTIQNRMGFFEEGYSSSKKTKNSSLGFFGKWRMVFFGGKANHRPGANQRFSSRRRGRQIPYMLIAQEPRISSAF